MPLAAARITLVARDLIVLAAWAIAGLAVAVATFRWEPHRPTQRRAARAPRPAGPTGPGPSQRTAMEKAGVPISIVSKWAGHYDAAFTMKTYVHASDEDLKRRGPEARHPDARPHPQDRLGTVRSCER